MTSIQAQSGKLYKSSYPVLASETISSNVSLRIYDEGATVKKVYEDTLAVSLETPEHVLASIASSTSFAWDVFHAENGTAKQKTSSHYDKIAKLPMNHPVFELDYVMEIEEGTNEGFSFIRFRILGVGEKKPTAGYFFTKIDGTWKLESNRRSIEENYALLILKTSVVQEIFSDKGAQEDAEVTVLRDQVKGKTGINLSLLGRLVWSWFQPGTEKPNLIEKFCDNPNWN